MYITGEDKLQTGSGKTNGYGNLFLSCQPLRKSVFFFPCVSHEGLRTSVPEAGEAILRGDGRDFGAGSPSGELLLSEHAFLHVSTLFSVFII